MRTKPDANEVGIWKSYVPHGVRGEFDNYDPVGLMAGTLIPWEELSTAASTRMTKVLRGERAYRIGQVPVDTDDDSGGSGGAKPQNNIDDFIVHGERFN